MLAHIQIIIGTYKLLGIDAGTHIQIIIGTYKLLGIDAGTYTDHTEHHRYIHIIRY